MLKKLHVLLLVLLAAVCFTATAWADYDYIEQYGVMVTPNTEDGSLLITVKLEWTPLEELPYGQELKIGTTVSCTVEEVIEAKGATSIPQGKFVMSISNKAGEWLQETIRSLEVGDTVDLSISSEDTRWNKVVDAVGAMH